MSCEPVIRASGLGKCYQLYAQPQDRLKQFLWRGKRQYFREFWALRDLSFEVMQGEVVGIVGRNGSGKSTLLQLVCGTLNPTDGEVSVQGRVAALLELGAGFNPEFTGRENVFMSAAIMGLPQEEIAARFEDIVDFSGIRDFIDQPVKTYSSGMYVRLAFSVAISVDPDILIIDEALSVGDGEFSRKSFDRIMALKNAGKTILFCSHSLYQVEALCSRVIWMERGQAATIGAPAAVIAAYNAALDRDFAAAPEAVHAPLALAPGADEASPPPPSGTARIAAVRVFADGTEGRVLALRCEESELAVEVTVLSDPTLAVPSVAIGLVDENGRAISSTGSFHDGLTLSRTDGRSLVRLVFERLPLMKGKYRLHVGLLCERGLHLYDSAANVAELEVTQRGLEQGVVVLPHRWEFADARG